jgi:hypothetical protein
LLKDMQAKSSAPIKKKKRMFSWVDGIINN